MADSFTATLNLRKPEVGAANDTWGGSAGLNSDMDLIDAVFLATGLGTPVGLNIGPSMVLNVNGEIQIANSTDLDTTKVAQFDSSLISTGTTRTFQFPDENGVLATQVDVAIRCPTGTVLSGYYGGAPAGFVMADGRTIGDATSGATNRANADTAGLFTLFWNLGFTPSGGRGASAATDYAAHKTMTLPNHSGRTMVGRDNLSGTAAGILSGYTANGVIGGEQTHTLTYGELAVHNHAVGQSVVVAAGANYTVPALGPFSYSTDNAGSNVPHNNIQPSIAVDVIIAL